MPLDDLKPFPDFDYTNADNYLLVSYGESNHGDRVSYGRKGIVESGTAQADKKSAMGRLYAAENIAYESLSLKIGDLSVFDEHRFGAEPVFEVNGQVRLSGLNTLQVISELIKSRTEEHR